MGIFQYKLVSNWSNFRINAWEFYVSFNETTPVSTSSSKVVTLKKIKRGKEPSIWCLFFGYLIYHPEFQVSQFQIQLPFCNNTIFYHHTNVKKFHLDYWNFTIDHKLPTNLPLTRNIPNWNMSTCPTMVQKTNKTTILLE